MNRKILLVFFAALFFFAAGICFHSLLPRPVRELAAVETGSREPQATDRGDARVSRALEACLSTNNPTGRVNLNKVRVDGRNWSILTMACTGERAKALYDAVAPFSTEQYVPFSDGKRGVGRFFGRLFPPSQCVRAIGVSRGAELNLYTCSVRLDLDHELVKDLRL